MFFTETTALSEPLYTDKILFAQSFIICDLIDCHVGYLFPICSSYTGAGGEGAKYQYPEVNCD